MKLLVRNIFRKPLRTLLTIFGVAVALFLFCFLEAVLEAFNAGVAMSDASRLVIQPKESLSFQMPMSHRYAIEQIEGVKLVAGGFWFGGPYEVPGEPGEEKRKEFFPQFAMDMERYLPMYPEIKLPPGQFKAFQEDQTGCILGDKIAERIHKKVGDRIVLKGEIWGRSGGGNWEFTVRAIYSTDSPTFNRDIMYFHLKYFDESRQLAKGQVGIYIVYIDNPNRYQVIADRIDARFANGPHETRTMTEKAFNMQFVSMMGNLKLLLRSIGSAVVLTMLLISANTMMMSARERVRELGIMKSLGFSDGYVFRLLVGESLLIVTLGTLFGAGGAWLIINVSHFNPKPDFFPVFYVPTLSMLGAFGIAVLTGLISGLVPAVNGMRLNAAEALKSV